MTAIEKKYNESRPLTEEKGIGNRLKVETADLHKKISKLPFAQSLAAGTVSEEKYVQYLKLLKIIFDQLEMEIKSAIDTKVVPLKIPEIFRGDKLDLDLLTLHGHSYEDLDLGEIDLKITDTYKPHKIIAHAYLHYLGGLFGGQIMKKAMEKRWSDAVELYDFEALMAKFECKSTYGCAKKYREILNNLPLTVVEENEIIEESRRAYEMMEQILNKLGE